MSRSRLAIAALVVVAACVLSAGCRGEDANPWLFCTTNPCQPLALYALPTPPALSTDSSLAATCDYSGPGAGDGVLLWRTDWDPRTEQGSCVSREEAQKLGAN